MSTAQEPAGPKKTAKKTAAADPAARTAALASKLRNRADRRASRSVTDELVVSTAPLAPVVQLTPPPADGAPSAARAAEALLGPAAAPPAPAITGGPSGDQDRGVGPAGDGGRTAQQSATAEPAAGDDRPDDVPSDVASDVAGSASPAGDGERPEPDSTDAAPVHETGPQGPETGGEPGGSGPDGTQAAPSTPAPPAERAPAKRTAAAGAAPSETSPRSAAARKQPARQKNPAAESPRPVAGPDGRLELSGERVDKMTLELPLPLVYALAIWERDETKATGQRVYRERLIDCALSQLPEDVDLVVELARSLPVRLRHADTEQVGTRVRESIKMRLKDLRPELRVRRVKDVYLRHVYAAAIARYLTDLGVAIPEEQ